MNSLAMAFLILVPSPPLVQPGAVAPPQAPLEPLNTLYQILDSMVKVIGWCTHNPPKLNQMLCHQNILPQVYGRLSCMHA